MTFFRQIAVLLPSAFLLGVLLFLSTHGKDDPGFGTYPFFEEWAGESLRATGREIRFVEQSAVFFLPAYAVTLLFVLCVSVAESALFGRRPATVPAPAYRRTFAGVFSALFLVGTGALVVAGDRLAARYTPGAVVAPLLVAFAPFGGAVLALAPAALLAFPVAALRRAGDA